MSDYCINQILFFFHLGKLYMKRKGKQRTMQGAGKQKTGTGGAELHFLFHCSAVSYQLIPPALPDLQLVNKNLSDCPALQLSIILH